MVYPKGPGSQQTVSHRWRLGGHPVSPGFVVAFAVGVLSGCGGQAEGQGIELLRTFPHDPTAYTQGLLFDDGKLYESTGRYAESTLREIDPETGEVLRTVELADEYFGEGLALVGDRLIQITWKEGAALLYDRETLEPTGSIPYQGDGWGLCADDEVIYMTTGGSLLHLRDPATFATLETRPITLDGRALWQVNELECVGDYIYGNVYMTDRIVKIEKASGEVVAEYSAAALTPEGGRPTTHGAVLNGIAYDPEREVFYLTGKLWSSMFEVRFPD